MNVVNKIRRLAATLRGLVASHEAMAGAVLALAIKGAGAVLMIVIFMLAARTMPATAFGEIAVWFNVLSCLAVAAVLGQENLIVRSWAEYASAKQLGMMAGAYRFGWITSGAGAVAACLALVVVQRLLGAPLPPLALAAAVAFLAAQTMLHYSSHSCRTIHGFRLSEFNRELTWRLVLLIVVGLHLHGDLTLATFFGAAAGGMCLSIAIQTVATSRVFPAEVATARRQYARGEWFERARSMCLSASVEAMGQYAEVILLGFLVAPTAAATYFIAARIANIFAMISSGLNTYTVTQISTLHFAGETEGLQHVLRSVMSVVFALVTPLFVLLVIAAAPILSIFGPSYAAGYVPLATLATASFVITLCGPASGILMMTGGEKLWSRIAILSLALRILLMLYLAPRYGASGAAFGWAIVNAPVAIAVSLVCRRRCGVDASALSIVPVLRKLTHVVRAQLAPRSETLRRLDRPQAGPQHGLQDPPY
jgi:O-antigen/teichoic acid export membrane protein